MVFKCKICNKDYKSYQSLWNHNHKFHSSANNQCNDYDNQNDNHKSYDCSKCNKSFKHFQNRWRHEQTCNKIKSNDNNQEIIIKKLDQLTDKITKLEKKTTKKFINNGTIVNGTNTTNKLIINKFGTENILELNDKEITDIFNKEIEGVIKLIEFVNFNERLPSNHNFCTTALDSPYLSTYNTETNTIDKDRKKYFFDELFSKAIERQEILYNKNKNIFSSDKRTQIEDNISNLKKISNYDFNNKIVKEIMKKLNLLSYNKRNIVQKTWKNDPNEDTDDEYFAKLSCDDEDTNNSYEHNELIEYVEVYNNDIPFIKIKDTSEISESQINNPLFLKKQKKYYNNSDKEIIV